MLRAPTPRYGDSLGDLEDNLGLGETMESQVLVERRAKDLWIPERRRGGVEEQLLSSREVSGRRGHGLLPGEGLESGKPSRPVREGEEALRIFERAPCGAAGEYFVAEDFERGEVHDG